MIDGLRDTHDAFRKRQGSFDRVMNAIDLIANEKRLPTYDIVTCVSPMNIGELAEMKQLLIAHKVKAWRFFTIAPIGRAAADDGLRLDGAQLKQLMDFIVETRKEAMIDAKFSCEAYLGKYDRKVRDWHYFCRAGINIGSVLIDGSILPIDTNKYLALLLGLLMGLCVDLFNSTLGLHASAGLLVAFVRSFALDIYSPHDGYENNKQLSVRNYGYGWFIKYAFTIIIIHHLWIFLFESMNFANILFTLAKVCVSSLTSLIVILLFHLLLMSRK